MKPWARYEIGFINHRKFLALNAPAICLWIEGKDYADEQHTDGLLPRDAVKQFRFYSPKAVTLLTGSAGPKSALGDVDFAPLWTPNPIGWQMHDYLMHNQSREEVLAQLAEAEVQKERARELDREYKRRGRAARTRTVDVRRASGGVSGPKQPDSEPDSDRKTGLSGSTQNIESRTYVQREKTLSVAARAPDEAFERAGNLIRNYAEWYSQHRKGAKLRLIGNRLEFDEACSLCAVWDDARLEKLAAIVLTTDDPFIANTDRSFKIFALKSSWADDKLRQWEAEQARAR